MKFLSALLAIIMLLSVLTACAKPTLDITQTDTNGSDIFESNISTEATSDSETQESVKESEIVDNSEPSKETDKDEEKPLTKFEKQFSVENEKRLAEILSSSVQEAELIEGSNIPTVSTAYSKKRRRVTVDIHISIITYPQVFTMLGAKNLLHPIMRNIPKLNLTVLNITEAIRLKICLQPLFPLLRR
jgi:hypothetical protein